MNERIKELARQADFCMWADEPWNPGDVIDWGARYDKELEKFAELIVRECAEVAGCNGHVSGFTLGDLIKEHFGVE